MKQKFYIERRCRAIDATGLKATDVLYALSKDPTLCPVKGLQVTVEAEHGQNEAVQLAVADHTEALGGTCELCGVQLSDLALYARDSASFYIEER